MNYTKFMMGVSCLRGRLRNDGTRVGAKTDFIFTCNTLFLCKVFEERRKNKVKNALLLHYCLVSATSKCPGIINTFHQILMLS